MGLIGGPAASVFAHAVSLSDTILLAGAALLSSVNHQALAACLGAAALVVGCRPKFVVLIIFNFRNQTEEVVRLAGSNPVPIGQVLAASSTTVTIPSWLRLYITSDQMLEEWLGRVVVELLHQLASHKAAASLDDTPVSRFIGSLASVEKLA